MLAQSADVARRRVHLGFNSNPVLIHTMSLALRRCAPNLRAVPASTSAMRVHWSAPAGPFNDPPTVQNCGARISPWSVITQTDPLVTPTRETAREGGARAWTSSKANMLLTSHFPYGGGPQPTSCPWKHYPFRAWNEVWNLGREIGCRGDVSRVGSEYRSSRWTAHPFVR